MPKMANKPVISPEQWAALKAASIRGVTDDELARAYGVKPITIRVARLRDPAWKAALAIRTPKKVTPKVTTAHKKASEQLQNVVEESLESIAAKNPLLLARYVTKKIEKATQNDLVPDIESWKDLNTADSIVRRATGLDKPQAAVQLNVWQGTGGPILREVEGVYDAETSPIESQEEED